MRPPLWHPPVALSTAEHAIITRIRRAQWFVFLRPHRHELFAHPFPQELATLSQDQPPGPPPVPPAHLALATVLQASAQVSDDAVIAATLRDRRWQLGRDCLDGETPPFRQGPLVAFRPRVIAQQCDRRLRARPVESAAASGAFGPRQVRAALERSPLWGAGRVADPYTLLGHALRKALRVIARQQGRGLRAVAEEAGASLVAGPRVKAALELDWEAPGAPQHALTRMLDALRAVEPGLDTPLAPAAVAPQVAASLAVAAQVGTPARTVAPQGTPVLRHGGAAERRISVEEAELRHGRQSRSLRVDGDKRHVRRDVDARLLVAVGSTPANAPEARVPEAIATDLAAQHCRLRALPIDRASLARTVVQPRPETWAICCTAWPVHQGPYCPKSAFPMDWERHERQCPGGVTMPCAPGGLVQVPAAPCAACTLRPRCPTSASGRRVSIHPDAALLQAWRARQQTPQGRATLRERVAVEHALAHVGRWQGRRARYGGVQKNVFDLRRCAVVPNLHVLMRLPQTGQAA
jgi:hypothetical protein